jgi:hypothetical protein
MIRNTMLALSFLALTGVSAVAAPAVHHATTRMVAEGDAPAPAADAKPAKKMKKGGKKKADAPKADAPKADAK